MYKDKRILGLIPARGGSKGLAGKNIRNLHGKPLIGWTIEAGKESGCFDTLMVSTDSEKIAEIGQKYGAEIPYLRHAKMSGDTTPIMDVIMHTLDWYGARAINFDIIVLLQPTSPLRNAHDIKRALTLYTERDARAVVSVCRAEHHPFWMNTLPADGCMIDFLPEKALNTPRQQLPSYYRLNGALYMSDTVTMRNTNTFFGPKTYAYIMEAEHSVDIDDLLDFHRAELLMQERVTRKSEG
ncbi:MAG: acylneuraminate cytidylyltransferase family protein [Desulfobulbaceae bacterium]|nr:acylneuraminate cytidylyltransferase family protein [Desulfobulbaceae bacterium]